jgi:hypothetical protein
MNVDHSIDLKEHRRREANRTLARLMAKQNQCEHPNKGWKQLAEEYFVRLESAIP